MPEPLLSEAARVCINGGMLLRTAAADDLDPCGPREA